MRIFVLLPLLMVLGISFSAAQDSKSELRTWTAVNGKEVEAEFVSNSDGLVSLKMKTGKVFKVPLNKLSKADQDFLKAKSPPKKLTKQRKEPAPLPPEEIDAIKKMGGRVELDENNMWVGKLSFSKITDLVSQFISRPT